MKSLVIRSKLKSVFMGIFIVIAVIIFGIFFILRPTNNRNWEVGMDILPDFNIQGNQVDIKNFHDFRYDHGQTISMNYIQRSVDVTKLTKVWFVQEPFTIKPFTGFGGVAHTYFVFDFSNQAPVVVSVEARREKGQKFDAWQGLFNQYELIYIWGSEQDETIERVIIQNNKLYMYPLQISNSGGQQLFMQLAQASKDLETTPRFYNTLTSNCTNELAKAADRVKANAIPFNRALFFPGYSDIELYKLGYISNNLPFEQTKQKYYISDLVKQLYNQNDFSKILREKLN